MTLKELRESSGMTRHEFADYFEIPYRTIQNWELYDSGSSQGRQCPGYLLKLIQYKLENENILK